MPATKVAPVPQPPQSEPQVEVFAVHGAEPEVQAYAMAKYSRSALSMKESLKEISEQKAEKFLNTFYFQYGHRSIADLAHVAVAIERLSLLAAIAAVDEQRWDGQERSTRYQDFQKSGYFVPDFGADAEARRLYLETVDFLFAEYQAFSEPLFEHLRGRTPRPTEMKEEAYNRILRARAFDISRYLLPLATNTSLGEIVNARTLESQVSRLLTDEHAEVRRLGGLLKEAACGAAYNVNEAALGALVEEIRARDPELGDRAAQQLLKPVRVAPTLVKYADPNLYLARTREELRQAAQELMAGAAVAPAPLVDLLDDEPLEIELATTLLYERCEYSYRQLREAVAALSAARREELIALGTKHRGAHDELLRAFNAGQRLRFDILMDIGGFRDMHRHRRCTQILQGFTTAHGYETPEDIPAAGLAGRYDQLMQRAAEASARVGAAHGNAGEYLIPLACRKRALFKMDFAEAVYIAELRTTPAGHFSYRRVAWEMYRAVAERYPALAPHFRVTDVNEPVDLLKR